MPARSASTLDLFSAMVDSISSNLFWVAALLSAMVISICSIAFKLSLIFKLAVERRVSIFSNKELFADVSSAVSSAIPSLRSSESVL